MPDSEKCITCNKKRDLKNNTNFGGKVCVRTASRNHFCAVSENGAENATESYRQTNASSAYISNAMTRKNRMSGMVEMNVVAR